MTAGVLDAAARERLALLADALIPAGRDMPSASEAGVTAEWLDAVLAAEPGFEAPLASVLAAADTDDPTGELRRIETTDPGRLGRAHHRGGGRVLPQPGDLRGARVPGPARDPDRRRRRAGLAPGRAAGLGQGRGAVYRPTP